MADACFMGLVVDKVKFLEIDQLVSIHRFSSNLWYTAYDQEFNTQYDFTEMHS